jgi:hypothetical protein
MPRVSTSLLDWLKQEQRSGGRLTHNIPGVQRPMHEWIGQRLIWWPRGIPPGERVGILSSRLGSFGRLGSHWFAALRQICRDMCADGQLLVTAQGTALEAIIERCSRLFHIPMVLFELARPQSSPERWLADCIARDATCMRREGECWPAIVSPPLSDGAFDLIPARDAMVVVASDRIIACRVRRGGHICRLLERRLGEISPAPDPRVALMVGEGFVARRVARDLAAQGAALLEVAPRRVVPVSTAHVTLSECESPRQILAVGEIPVANYLCHCTRGTDGPWPDQDRAEYLDSLILGRPEAAHSALAALTRIVRQRRLLATGRAIRGGTPVVCFTAAGIAEIRHLRTFRTHRRRWDFEPYGIGLARDWLQQCGGRPVVYGDEALWNTLADSQRPYFQRRCCGKNGAIDWSIEREWRHVGDLDLENLPPDAGFVFVPSMDEARHLIGLSRWPVVVLS